MKQPENVSPEEPSRQRAWQMFDRIAHRYDLLNRLLSFGRDVAWRRRMAHRLPDAHRLRILDLATGTADVLLFLDAQSGRVARGVGVDMSAGMLAEGREKVMRAGSAHTLALVRGDATSIPLASGTFDVVTIAFGVRNVVDVDVALREMRRVLRPGGRALVLEFSLPRNPLIRIPYLFYFRHILPRVGGLISGDAGAYRYLNRTVETFPYGEAFCAVMTAAGFDRVNAEPLTFGVATLYVGEN